MSRKPIVTMFPDYVFLLLHIFNYWGFCTESAMLRTSRWWCKRWTVTVLAINIVVLFCLTGLIWHYLNKSETDLDFLNVTNDFIKFAGALVAHLIVIFESYHKRNVQRNFWMIYCRIRTDFNRLDSAPRFGTYMTKFGEFFCAMIAIIWRLFARELGALNAIIFISSMMTLLSAHLIRVFHYLFFVHLLSYQLSEVDAEMRRLADDSKNGTVSRQRLRSIRMYFDLVHELSDCINEFFGWSNVVSVSYLFMLFAVDSIWNYFKIQELRFDYEGECIFVLLLSQWSETHFH